MTDLANPEYATFLASKAPVVPAKGCEPGPIEAPLFDYQRAAVEFCVRRGRAALFLDTGLGKTLCELEFCRQAIAATGRPALILTPLAVARQIEREGQRFGYDARVVREQAEVGAGSNICNYDRLDKLEAGAFGCVALDESSILKSFMGSTTRALIEMFAATPFRLAATATPAPNDHMELGTHAEFLGIMPRADMLVRWFINDTAEASQSWRLKHHAVADFWNWMSSWAVMAETPDDLGFDGSRFILPPMTVHRHRVAASVTAAAGALFAADLSATNIHELKRQTADARAAMAAGVVASDPGAPWLLWVDTDYEADAVREAIPEAAEVRGSMTPDRKEAVLDDFSAGRARILITKSSISGFGMNWQHCRNMIFVGRSFSYESWYQAVRRCWRFGQALPVHVHLIVAEGEDQIGRVIARKSEDHAEMKAAMRAAARRAAGRESVVKQAYDPRHQGRMPSWLTA